MKKLSILFQIASAVAMSGWAMLFFKVDQEWSTYWIHTVVVGLLGAFYLGLLFFGKKLVTENYPTGNFFTLDGVITLFKNPVAVLAGWIHYLAFDLMMGWWISQEAHKMGMPFWWQVPCLVLTLMFGPAGLLFFFY